MCVVRFCSSHPPPLPPPPFPPSSPLLAPPGGWASKGEKGERGRGEGKGGGGLPLVHRTMYILSCTGLCSKEMIQMELLGQPLGPSSKEK